MPIIAAITIKVRAGVGIQLGLGFCIREKVIMYVYTNRGVKGVKTLSQQVKVSQQTQFDETTVCDCAKLIVVGVVCCHSPVALKRVP